MRIGTIGNKAAGFTLMELMIVVVIIGILLAVVMPNYSDSVRKSRRADAMKELMEMAAQQERFYAQNSTYTEDITSDAGLKRETDITSAGHYRLKSEACAAPKDITTCYLLTATPLPTSSQAKDTECGALSLRQTGERLASGVVNRECW